MRPKTTEQARLTTEQRERLLQLCDDVVDDDSLAMALEYAREVTPWYAPGYMKASVAWGGGVVRADSIEATVDALRVRARSSWAPTEREYYRHGNPELAK